MASPKQKTAARARATDRKSPAPKKARAARAAEPARSLKPAQKRKPAPKAEPAPKKKPAAAATAPKLKGSAGPRILGDLGLTDAELFAFLPADAPKWVRGVFSCQLDCDRSLEQLMAHFAPRYEASIAVSPKFPEDAPPEGVPVRQLSLRPKGKYVAYTFYGMRGARYVEDGSLQLEVSFRESGTDWGSNRAVYERFKALELPSIGARNVVELTE